MKLKILTINFCLVAIGISGCSTTSSNSANIERAEMSFSLTVSEWVNPNVMAGSSPVQLFLIPLKSVDKFYSTSKQQLLINLEKSLEGDLIGTTRELILMPGEKLSIKWLAPCPGYVGLLVNFRLSPEVESEDKKIIACNERTFTNWFGSPKSWLIELAGNSIVMKPMGLYGIFN